uniref:Carbohydrate kinase PfkB domain-containing protein n=1 Tax=Stomoxys calcitrans TaxID=35570 RepID=A0A1I8NUG8_STOCA
MFWRSISSVPLKLRGRYKIPKFCRAIHSLLDVHPNIKNALSERKPVVALESTIITHGMPYPHNMDTALEVEDVVRSAGATPATIACIDGRLMVGLSKEDIKKLSEVHKLDVLKCSRRDLPYVVANRKCAGTTVAATMIIAHMAGIRIFATGGVGGVHRDGHISLDISADLVELGRTPVVVVSSGVKSILDIPRTLEFLETHGVSVASFGNGGRFPDFYTRDSGCKAPYNLESPEEAAFLIKAVGDLNLKSGMLIGVPIPEEYALDKEVIRKAIDTAYAEALAKGIEGKNVTPFMLAAVADITKGSSLKANIALIKNNAKVAAKIACELSNFQRRDKIIATSNNNDRNKPMVIGASIIDHCLTMLDDSPLALDGATYQTNAKVSAGGVGRNLAESIHKLHGRTSFISVVGCDHTGKSLLELMPKSLRPNIHIDNENTTSICSILFDRTGNCKLCLANMEIHKSISPQLIKKHEQEFITTPLVVIDGNLSLDAMQSVLELSRKYKKPVFFEPTDMLIAGKPFQLSPEISQQIRFISPNVYELKAIVEKLTDQTISWDPNNSMGGGQTRLINDCKDLLKLIEKNFDCIVVTLGAHGVLVNMRGSSFAHRFFNTKSHSYTAPPSKIEFRRRFYKAPTVSNISNVSGAGDSFSGGFITGLLRGFSVDESISFGFVAATSALQSESAVPVQYFSNEEEEKKMQEKQLRDLRSIDI